MFYWLIGILLCGLLLAIPLPKALRQKPLLNRRNRKYRSSGAILFGIQEVFQPTAKNASEIIQESREALKPMPSPEDKLKKKLD